MVKEMSALRGSQPDLWDEYSVVTFDGGCDLLANVTFPVHLRAVFVPGGWRRTAADRAEFQSLLSHGLKISQVGEVLIGWERKAS